MGPCPMQLVVVSAVKNAVRAATNIFTATSISLFRFIEKKKYTFIFLRCDVELLHEWPWIFSWRKCRKRRNLFWTLITMNRDVNLPLFFLSYFFWPRITRISRIDFHEDKNIKNPTHDVWGLRPPCCSSVLCLKVNFRTSQNYIPVLFQNSSIMVAKNIALRAENICLLSSVTW